jgi:hypothetical protein
MIVKSVMEKMEYEKTIKPLNDKNNLILRLI